MLSHPQIAQRTQCDDVHRVLLVLSGAHLHVPKLLLEHSERMPYLGSDAGLGAFKLVDQRIYTVVFLHCLM